MMLTRQKWENTEFLYLVLNYAKCVIIILHVQLYSVWLTAILYHTLPDTVVGIVVIIVVVVDVVVVVVCCRRYRRRCLFCW